MDFKKVGLMGSLVALFATTNLSAAIAEQKIGVINTREAVEATELGKKAKTDFDQYMAKKQTEIDKKKGEIQKKAEEFRKKSMVMTDDAKAKTDQELQQEYAQLQQTAMTFQREAQLKQKELFEPILKKMQATIDSYSKEKGFDMLIEQNAGVVFVSEKVNVTADVIKLFEQNNKKSK